MDLRRGYRLLADTVAKWSEDRAPRLAAALAYYAAFSFAPILLIAIGLAGVVFGVSAGILLLYDLTRVVLGHARESDLVAVRESEEH